MVKSNNMEERASLSEQILSILASSASNETPVSQILSATNVPKKSLNAELQKLKRQGLIAKIRDKPPVWSLKDTKLVSRIEPGVRHTRSRTMAGRESGRGKLLKKSVAERIARSAKGKSTVLNKDLSKRILSFLHGRSKAVKTIEIAKAVGCKTAKEINPTLYGMQRKDMVVKVTESPPSWSVSDNIPQELLHQVQEEFQPNTYQADQQALSFASPVSGSGDGAIPAFQDTSLFNSDVSFKSEYSDLISGGDSFNNSEVLFDEYPQNASASSDTENGEGESNKKNVDKSEKPSSFRNFFRLDEFMSDDSDSEDMFEADNECSQSNTLECEISETHSHLHVGMNVNDNETLRGKEENTDAESTSVIGNANLEENIHTTLKNEKDLLNDQNFLQAKTDDQLNDPHYLIKDGLERNSSSVDSSIEAVEVLPNELPDQLPLDQDSDVDDDIGNNVVMDEDFRHDNNWDDAKVSGNNLQGDLDEVSLSSDCQKLIKVFNLAMPVALFALKSKSKLDDEKLTECLQKLEAQDIAVQEKNFWRLTDNGKELFKHISHSSIGSGMDQSDQQSVQMPGKKPKGSGPPLSPMALLQKEKGAHMETAKESPLSFLKTAPKVDPFKQISSLTHNRKSGTIESGSHNNIEKLNTTLFPGTKPVTDSFNLSAAQISSNSDLKETQNSATSAFTSRPTNAPMPLMSLNLEDRFNQRSSISNFSSIGQQRGQTDTSSFTDKSMSGSGLFQQGPRLSSSQTSNSAPNQLLNSSFRQAVTSVSVSMTAHLTQTSAVQSSMLQPNQASTIKSSFPQPPDRTATGQSAGQTSASSFKPPLTPADILARTLKKTEISPPKTVESLPVSLMSGSQSVQLNTAQKSVAGNHSIFKPLIGPHSLPAANKIGSQLSGGSFQIQTYQSGILSSNQTGMISSQMGIRSLIEEEEPQSLGSHCGFKPLSMLKPQSQALPLGQFSSMQPQNIVAARTTQPSNQSLSLDEESFAALNKNPVSALMEYAQSRKLEARIELVGRRGAAHRPIFEMAAFVGRRQFPSVQCSNKKDGKKEACDIALRQLIAEGQFHQSSQAAKPSVAPTNMTHFDKMAALTHRGFTALVSQIRSESFAGRKVIAGLIMKRSETDTGILISLGTGNRCITGQQLSLEGNTINDSHAEIITRRGFLRFLYKQLLDFDPNKTNPLFERSPRGKIQVRPNITFHLYISTAPCGDGALFSPRDAAANNSPVDNRIRPPHNPTFTSNVQGLLRTKVEGGEGTIPIEAGFKGQTFDGIQRGERLLTMSCTDKVCRWNVVGLQGALLSHFLEPIYLDSLTLGLLYDHGHLARAVCCRVARGETDVDNLLPPGYKLNHPWLGRVTACDPPREVQKTKALSVNWSFGDKQPEVVDGTLGLNLTSIEKEMFSRCSKRNLYNSFKKVCAKFGRQDLQAAQTYREAKKMANDFKTAKEAMLKKFKENKYGKWVSKPVEEEMFN